MLPLLSAGTGPAPASAACPRGTGQDADPGERL